MNRDTAENVIWMTVFATFFLLAVAAAGIVAVVLYAAIQGATP